MSEHAAISVSLAQVEHLKELSEVFDQYRVFYNQPSNINSVKQFLHERLKNRDSVIFVAECNQTIIGFVQLYPSFSSVALKRVWILNDLFVVEDYRRRGIAKLLMDAAERYAAENDAVRVVLATQITNIAAQRLYESRNYVKDRDFYHYTLRLT